MRIAVVDALARASGRRYATFDVVGAGPRTVAGLLERYFDVDFYPYEKALSLPPERVSAYSHVLISLMSSDLGAGRKLIDKWARSGFGGRVIVGGPASFGYEEVLGKIPRADIVVIGEGEIPLISMRKFLEAGDIADLEGVPAIAYRAGEGIRVSGPHVHTPREVLSSIEPFVRVDEAFDTPQVYRFYVEVVRGCSNFRRPLLRGELGLNCVNCGLCIRGPSELRLRCPAGIPPGCGFCGVPHMFGYARSRDIEPIAREVEGLIEHGARRIVLSAPDFLDYGRDLLVNDPLTDPCSPDANVDRLEGLLNRLSSIEEVSSGKVVISVENIKACLVDGEVADVFGRYLRGTTVHIGLETGDDRYNEVVLGKPIKVAEVVRASKLLRERGLRPYVYLMYGLPLANEDVYRATMDAVRKLAEVGVEKITLYKFQPLPGTAFERARVHAAEKMRVVNELRNFVERYNMTMKRNIVGKSLEAYISRTNGRYIAYPVLHGPVIYLDGVSGDINGCRALVKVTDIGPRSARGRVLKILERPRRT